MLILMSCITSIQIRSLSLAMDPPVGGLFNAMLMSAYRKY